MLICRRSCRRLLPIIFVAALSPFGANLAQEPAPPPAASPVEFVRHVMPVLTKSSCNSGACHGSFQGRGGFRLSLLGFDPPADYQALVQEARGRRVFPAAPDRSLILKKATGQVPHGGGTRMSPESISYRILREWVASGGASGSKPDNLMQLRVARLEVQPREHTLQPGQKLQLKATATWSDGQQHDVTTWVQYGSQQENVATVSPEGEIEATGSGQAAVTLQFLGQVASAIVSVPFSQSIPPLLKGGPGGVGEFAWTPNNFIDELLATQWRKLGLAPAQLAGDAEFHRRACLDIIGTLPEPDDVRKFLASTAIDKRDKLVDELLARPEYVEYWSLRWGDLLRAHRRYLGEKGLASFQAWLRNNLRENRPLDGMVRELVTAKGNLYTRGPVAFYFVDQTPQELAETTAQIFLGVRMQCAKCHHHPFEVWSQDDYYGLAAFFARVQRKDTKEAGKFGGSQAILLSPAGSPNSIVTDPVRGGAVTPRVLMPLGDGTETKPVTASPAPVANSNEDERQVLADWITDPKNPFFARNLVNRYWAMLVGRGLVAPVDDQRATNPPSNPALLDALAADFVKSGFDGKHLIRTICRSRAYQLALEIAPQRDVEGAFFTHRRPHRLPAEVLLDAVNRAAGTSEAFAGLPEGQRAIGLPDSTIQSYFLEVFGRPLRTSTCDCARGSRADLKQVLHLLNGDVVQQKVAATQGRVAKLVMANKPDAEIVEELYLASLSRPPDAEEQAQAQELIRTAPNRQQALEDFLWALLNSAEFSYNH